jgi:spore coat polysaccharide biosynthesis protein SpsF (cytidylyltransferase family)
LVIDHPVDYGSFRWTVDTSEDLEFIQTVAKELGCQMNFSWLDVIEILKKHPGFLKINSRVKHKSFTDVDERVKGASRK